MYCSILYSSLHLMILSIFWCEIKGCWSCGRCTFSPAGSFGERSRKSLGHLPMRYILFRSTVNFSTPCHPNLFSSSVGMLSSSIAFFLFISFIALTTSDFSAHGPLSFTSINSSCPISISSWCGVFPMHFFRRKVLFSTQEFYSDP
uniref:Putative product n=1 Tax=Xenopsylla cheopis TaxID=163159 RepID=A0A6M2DYH8_XENCH